MFMLLVTGDRIGRGDEELGALLMKNFLYSLARAETKPDLVGFMNAGVRLTCEGSQSLDDLRLLAKQGVSVRSCGTCLDYLRLKDSLAVGEVGTMSDTVAAAAAAGKVITVG
ncbi:MAG: sulfurtransferase-like selenium metabolism protein YedF [Coriobacteriia bacterium]|nr:sulfurtransferase-like selenium metabolism protein YedF [Coriobacteriia bacterium]